MQLFNRTITLDLRTETAIGFAIGYSSESKTKQYELLFLCFVIEVLIESPIKKKSHQLYKKKKTFIAKLISSLILLSATVAGLGLYQATELNSPGLVLFSAVFTILFIVLGICYLAMDPKEKYKYV